MQLCFFEDEQCVNFKPLTLTRPVDDLRTGILTIGEKWRIALKNNKWTRCIRPELEKVFKNGSIDKNNPFIWINSRYLPSSTLLNHINDLQRGSAIKDNNTVVAAKVSEETATNWLQTGAVDFSSFEVTYSGSFRCINHLWDLFLINENEIAADIERLDIHSGSIKVSKKAILENEENIFIGEGAEIQAGAILTADNGPVYVGDNAKISAGAIIYGPAAICEKSTIKLGAKIRPNTTIGPFCTVGGEVSKSIFHSYSNKGHDGYAGNSLIGQWCNLGAGTNISNLKNNYSNVRATNWDTQKTIETGQQSLGTVMGDHTKTAIGTRLNTGTVCGVSCNIFSVDFPPKFMPSFSWVGSIKIDTYKLEKAFETMHAVMIRRDAELTEDYKKLMESIFEEEHNA